MLAVRRSCGSWDLGLLLLGAALGVGAGNCAAGQVASGAAPAQIPSASPAPPAAPAPAAKKPAKPAKPPDPCEVKNSGASMVATGGLRAVSVLGMGETERTAGASAVESKVCSHFVAINWYDRFVTGPDVMRFSPEQKLRLAMNNLINPFNLGTIVGEAGYLHRHQLALALRSGLRGLGQVVRHQLHAGHDRPVLRHLPHSRRHPHRSALSSPARLEHSAPHSALHRPRPTGRATITAAMRSTTPRSSLPSIDISISNLYVPGLQTHFSADAERYGVGLATAPIDNFITEFVPSIASRIHTNVVFMQRVINHVAVNPP